MDSETLFQTLRQRKRPEDVAEMVLHILSGQLTGAEENLLRKAAYGSLKNRVFGYTAMLESFEVPVGARRQISKAMEIFRLDQDATGNWNDPQIIAQFLEMVSPLIGKEVGQNDFRNNRMSRAERQAVGLDLSRRNYNKKWRLLKRIEAKLRTLTEQIRRLEYQQVAKHGLAHNIDYPAFAADLNSACFIAYYNARCNLRSTFTNTAQVRPFDQLCEMLLRRCFSGPSDLSAQAPAVADQPLENGNWWAIAHIYPSQEILDRLSAAQKGELLGCWTQMLEEIGGELRRLFEENEIARETMTVRRGNDSSTWNGMAGAWNKARDHWMSLIYALGMEEILEKVCFGKVLRLMAADVVAWHHMSNGGPEPNTVVWNALPLPWDVLQGTAHCNRARVIKACKAAGLDPEKSGWIAPRAHGVAAFTPTPELVHGVAVGSPFLAKILKQLKYFSGKKAPLTPKRTEDGLVQ